MSQETYMKDALQTEADWYPSFERIEANAEDYTRLLHASMGLVTEAGEFQDALKKTIFYGKPLDRVNLQEEIGDLFWYLAIACDALGVTFEEVQARNIAKLRARYPEKFTADKAINRDLDAERKVLEQ